MTPRQEATTVSTAVIISLQVIREREAAMAAKQEEATQGNSSEPPGEGDVNGDA